MEGVSLSEIPSDENENDEIIFEIAKFAKKRLPKVSRRNECDQLREIYCNLIEPAYLPRPP